MQSSELYEFIRLLKKCGLSTAQKSTLRGQALAGDLTGAWKGLQKILATATERAETQYANNRAL